MKRNIFLLIAVFTFCGISISAQTEDQKKEAIIIELKIKTSDGYLDQILDVAVDSNENSKSGGFGGGMGCSHCDKSELTSYSGNYKLMKVKPKLSEIKLSVTTESGESECSVKKKFKVFREKETELTLKCGVILKAYYGFEPEEETEQTL